MIRLLPIIFSMLLCCTQVIFGAELESSEERIRIKFFNVGQGNCTLVTYHAMPPLLVDSGSSTNPIYLYKEGVKVKKKNAIIIEINNEIVSGIKKWQTYRKFKKIKDIELDLNIVISHGDDDHCNYIKSLLESFLDKEMANTKKYKVRFLLGGRVEDYVLCNKNDGENNKKLKNRGKKLVEFIRGKSITTQVTDFNNRSEIQKLIYLNEYLNISMTSTARHSFTNMPIFVQEYLDNDKLIDPMYCGEEVSCTLLSTFAVEGDPNANSIVMKIEYAGRSVILVGDATKKHMTI